MRSTHWMAAFAVAVSLLGGCGGSSDSSSGGASAYDLDAAFSRYIQTSHNYNLTGTDGQNTFNAQISRVPGPAASFDAQKTGTSTDNAVIFENGALVYGDNATLYFEVDPFRQVGTYDSTTGHVTVFSDRQRLPTDAHIGDTGTLSMGVIYYDTSLTTVFGKETDTWSLHAGSGENARLCVDYAADSDAGTSDETDCYAIDPAGNVSGLSVDLVVDGVEVTFQ